MARQPTVVNMRLEATSPRSIPRGQIHRRVERFFREEQQPNTGVQFDPMISLAVLAQTDARTLWKKLNRASQARAPRFSGTLFHSQPIPFGFVSRSETLNDLINAYDEVYKHYGWTVTEGD